MISFISWYQTITHSGLTQKTALVIQLRWTPTTNPQWYTTSLFSCLWLWLKLQGFQGSPLWAGLRPLHLFTLGPRIKELLHQQEAFLDEFNRECGRAKLVSPAHHKVFAYVMSTKRPLTKIIQPSQAQSQSRGVHSPQHEAKVRVDIGSDCRLVKNENQ
jgi:hypothetical protein